MATDDVYRWNGFATQSLNQYMADFAFQSRLPGDPTPADLQTLADDLMAVFRPGQVTAVDWKTWTFTQLWGSNMTIDAPRCRRLGGKAYAGAFTPPTTGTNNATDALPPQCAMVTTLSTGFVGRRKRGRNYMFGTAEGDQIAGTYSTSVVSAAQARWNTLVTKYGLNAVTGSFRLGVWSERTASGCIPNETGGGHTQIDTPHPELAFTAISSAQVRNTVFTQRRRTLGVGR